MGRTSSPGKNLLAFLLLAFVHAGHAATTISPEHAHAWGANIGWVNWRADGANGAVIGEYFCSGHIYGANVGWISLGSGAPADGQQYQNKSASDFGVNVDDAGNLRGFAYGANIGWVNFEPRGVPKVDLRTGKLSGFIYGANVGWISLSNAVAFVQTDRVAPSPDSDSDGIPDAWELRQAANLTTLTAKGDQDGDGFSDVQEYLADTDPIESSDNLRITSFSPKPDRTSVTLTWTTKPTRFYEVQRSPSLGAGSSWSDLTADALSPDGGASTTKTFSDDAAAQRFYRVRAVRPLTP